MIQKCLKLAEKFDKQSKFSESDSITNYLLDLAKSKQLKSDKNFSSDIPTKLLILEKTGVETKNFFNKLKKESLNDYDLKSIDQKLNKNCPDIKINPKPTDLHEYIIWMNKNKDEPLNIDSDESKQYLSNLRNTFIEFLLDDVMQDFKKEHQEITPENLINYYFTNKEDYENKLDQYEISTDHGDGIITDQNFSDELYNEPIFRKEHDGPMEKQGD